MVGDGGREDSDFPIHPSFVCVSLMAGSRDVETFGGVPSLGLSVCLSRICGVAATGTSASGQLVVSKKAKGGGRG